jgi:hypothetical protein
MWYGGRNLLHWLFRLWLLLFIGAIVAPELKLPWLVWLLLTYTIICFAVLGVLVYKNRGKKTIVWKLQDGSWKAEEGSKPDDSKPPDVMS